jgi:glycosyltransferase involved in cell wall biosynthesis
MPIATAQRKRLDLTVQAFVRLLVREKDTPYYLIVATNVVATVGCLLRRLPRIYALELADARTQPPVLCAIAFSVSILHRPNVIADDGINQLYNVADIGINTSDGEGYGLCQLEHLYTGAPQVVTDVGAYSDFLDDRVAQFRSGRLLCLSRGWYAAWRLWCPPSTPNKVADAMETAATNLPNDARGD